MTMRTGFAVIWLWLLPPLAMAQESIPPIEELESIRVEWDVGNRSYYPIPAGSALSFDTPGPISLRVEVRIRIPVDTNLEERPRIMAQ